MILRYIVPLSINGSKQQLKMMYQIRGYQLQFTDHERKYRKILQRPTILINEDVLFKLHTTIEEALNLFLLNDGVQVSTQKIKEAWTRNLDKNLKINPFYLKTANPGLSHYNRLNIYKSWIRKTAAHTYQQISGRSSELPFALQTVLNKRILTPQNVYISQEQIEFIRIMKKQNLMFGIISWKFGPNYEQILRELSINNLPDPLFLLGPNNMKEKSSYKFPLIPSINAADTTLALPDSKVFEKILYDIKQSNGNNEDLTNIYFIDNKAGQTFRIAQSIGIKTILITNLMPRAVSDIEPQLESLEDCVSPVKENKMEELIHLENLNNFRVKSLHEVSRILNVMYPFRATVYRPKGERIKLKNKIKQDKEKHIFNEPDNSLNILGPRKDEKVQKQKMFQDSQNGNNPDMFKHIELKRSTILQDASLRDTRDKKVGNQNPKPSRDIGKFGDLSNYKTNLQEKSKA